MRKKGEKKKQQRRCVALQTLSSNSIPLPHAFNVGITCKIHVRSAIVETSKAGAEGRPDLSGTNFNLYSACLYQRWLAPLPPVLQDDDLRLGRQFEAAIRKVVHYVTGCYWPYGKYYVSQM